MDKIEALKDYPKVIKFIESLKKFPFGKADGKPLKSWKHYNTKDAAMDAAMNAALDAARNAAWYAAMNAAWNAAMDAARNAAWYAARNAAMNAARNAARNAAMDAAWYAARNAAMNAALDAALDAAIVARYILISDLKFKNKKKHQKYINDLWEVYKKGYFCLCDIDGVLYTYEEKK